MAAIGYIYLITNLVNGKRYVGQTKLTLHKRWGIHRSDAKKGSSFAIHAAIRKYGVGSFQVQCLEIVHTSHSDLLAAEIRHISEQNSLAPNGYNLTSGGQGLDYSIPLVRERHAEAMRKLPSNPAWRKAQAEGAARNATDLAWLTKKTLENQQKAQDPEWLKATAKANQAKAADPSWKKAQIEATRRNWGKPEFRERHAAAMCKRSESVEWQERNLEKLKKASAALIEKALQKDAECPPEERLRRQKRREYNRRYRERKAA